MCYSTIADIIEVLVALYILLNAKSSWSCMLPVSLAGLVPNLHTDINIPWHH